MLWVLSVSCYPAHHLLDDPSRVYAFLSATCVRVRVEHAALHLLRVKTPPEARIEKAVRVMVDRELLVGPVCYLTRVI